MIERLEDYIVTVKGEEFDLRNDLGAVAAASGRQKTYLRRPTKIQVYKELMNRFPEKYEEIKKYYWFSSYKNEVEGNFETEEIKENREMEGMNFMNKEVLERLTNAIEGISDKHRIDFAKDQIEEYSKEFIKTFIEKTYGALPTMYDIRVTDDKVKRVEGVTHKIFPKVCKLINMRKPVMLTGPAGTGKNFMLEQVATALDLDFYYSSTITQEYKLTGFIDGSGNYHETEFYKAMKNGGLFMLDEIDASIPECLVVLNAALANGYFDFPNGRLKAHDNFRVCCAGNTVGLGADMVYTGRNVIDGATLDRFILVKMNYDEDIEKSLCPNEELKSFIYDIRKSAQKNHINCIVGMRCLSYAYEMLVNGFDKEEIVQDSIIKGLQEDDINVLKNDLDSSNEWYKYFKYVK